ncbi:dihydrolipoyl dehydrogenase [Pseudomonas matsuisoli]|uniref:Dihydrolipoyl dehydrogenase n=1 Tax=Pseudomonas matsuisoli TaxID=1515666 RepID=A0A917Q2Y2_9PSED|nr:dihydrolipoyl dehydrogenase [Pseudomonas matsuisoli]GGK08992.1 dihydrolipoyl dehydrogenase [Pseudomonas matsuisoli]
MMPSRDTHVLIIGGGPGGYIAAIRAAQLGLHTTLVEADALGGTCLNVGCIPSKALIHVADTFDRARQQADGAALGIRVMSPSLDVDQAVSWKNGIVDRLTTGVAGLLKKSGVDVINGWAKIIDGKTVEVSADGHGATQRIHCQHLVLATGSQSAELPNLPFGGNVLSATEALSPRHVPKHLVIVGAGYIGLELGTAYRKFGADVSIVESLPRILPSYDSELTKPVLDNLKRLGIRLYLGHRTEGMSEDRTALRIAAADNGETLELPADAVLVAVGRKPRTLGFNLEELMLDMENGAVKVNDQCRTSMRNVWAIGDLTGQPMLAHRAMAQGEMVAELIAGKQRHFTPAAIPAVCFTDPEVVVVGLTPEQAVASNLETKVGLFPFAANGRAMTLDARDGFVRVVARADNHRILGWQAVGVGVSELATAFIQSLEMGAQLEDMAGTIHAHPTLGEAVHEAALKALGRALHV